jgi:hypothetical protein
MRTGLIALLMIAGVMVAADTAEACVASGVLGRGRSVRTHEHYDNVEQVVTSVIGADEEWTKQDAIDAAIGTIYREAMEQSEWDELETVDKVMDFLDEEAFTMDPSQATRSFGTRHIELGVRTVRDHATLHGSEWEEEYDKVLDRTINNSNGGTWTRPVTITPVDHAG